MVAAPHTDISPPPSLPPASGATLLLYGLASGAWLATRTLRGGAASSSEGGGDFVEHLGRLVGGAADSVQCALHEVVPGWVGGGWWLGSVVVVVVGGGWGWGGA
jgi:hypothetical protein